MKSKNKDWFYYNEYFRNWVRVLVRGGGDFPHQVEIQITPINKDKTEWAELSLGLIRRWESKYSAFKSKPSQWTHELPDEVYNDIRSNLGPEITSFLVDADLYPLIDWNKYTALEDGSNKQIPFDKIKSDFDASFVIARLDDDGLVTKYLKEYSFMEASGAEPQPNSIVVGGVLAGVELPDNKYGIKMLATYHTVGRYVTIDWNYSKEGEEHISRFAYKATEKWDERFLDHIRELKLSGKLDEIIHTPIVQVVTSAAVALLVFNRRRSAIEG